MKIKTRGSQAFSVPNTEEGRLFMRLVRKFINPRWAYRRRGRGSRPKDPGAYRISLSDQLSLSPDHPLCEWVALYLFHPESSYIRLRKRRREAERKEAARAARPSFFATPRHSGTDGADPVSVPVPTAPHSAFKVSVVEWSAQIEPRDPIALDHKTGRVYNRAVHGRLAGDYPVGYAIGPVEGIIGDGTGTVTIRLDQPEVDHSIGYEVSSSIAEGDRTAEPNQPSMEDQARLLGLKSSEEQEDDAIDLTEEEIDILAYALETVSEPMIAENFAYSPEEAKDAIDMIYHKLKD